MSPTAMLTTLAMAGLLGIAAIRWQRVLVMSLPFAVVLNGLALPFGGVSMHLDQLVACGLAVPLIASTLIGARKLRTDATTWYLAAIFILNVVASALHSPARSYSLLQCTNLASVWLIYVLLLNFLERREDLDAFFERTLWAAIAASAIGVVAFALAVSGLSIGGAEVSSSAAQRLTKAYGAFGTMVEPNILGSFSAAYLVLSVVLLATTAQRPIADSRRRLLRWVVASTSVALVLTFTRGAWLGALVGLVFGLVRARRSSGRGTLRVRRVVAPLLVMTTLVGILLVLPGDAGTLFRFKLFNLLNVTSQTAVVRVVSYVLALQQTAEHAIVGWGTFTFAPLVAQGSDFQQFDNWRNLWIGNYLLLALHDTGVIGIGLWLAMLAGIFRGGIRAALAPTGVEEDAGPVASRTLGLTAAFVSLAVAFLATSGFSLGYSWLLIGLLGAHVRIAAEERRVPARFVDQVADADAVPQPSPVG